MAQAAEERRSITSELPRCFDIGNMPRGCRQKVFRAGRRVGPPPAISEVDQPRSGVPPFVLKGKASRILSRTAAPGGSTRTDTSANAASGHSWTSGLLGEQQPEEPSLRRRSVVGACELEAAWRRELQGRNPTSRFGMFGALR